MASRNASARETALFASSSETVPRHIAGPDMPLPPHPVEGEHDLAVQEEFDEPDRQDGIRCETVENPLMTQK